jgi:eukaryotic-like serine/threonine-protein kinase
MVENGGLLADRYRFEQKITSGGMGSVFRATDEKLGRTVAIKMLRADIASEPHFVDRFRREARAAAALTHPNITAVYDYGEEEGHPFIVMEFIEGRDLSEVLEQEGPLEPERAVALCNQILDALAYAHAAGLVHRDVKPGNVMVTGGGHVKVTDFGIARAVDDTTLTATGSVIGTVKYMAPEQASGERVGPPADLYALGVVLYEMLTNAVPYTGDSPITVAMRHVMNDVPPPSQLNPEVPLGLDEVVAQATTRDPAHRFSSAQEMKAALSGALRERNAVTLGMAVPPLAADATLPLERSAGETGDEQTVWPIPGNRYDPTRVGRVVVASFIVLALIAAAAFAWRVASRVDERNREGVPPVPVPLVTVPNVESLSLEVATERLIDEGLLAADQATDSSAPEGTVVSQMPAAGTEVEEGSRVTLLVSAGPDTGPDDKEKGTGPDKDKETDTGPDKDKETDTGPDKDKEKKEKKKNT